LLAPACENGAEDWRAAVRTGKTYSVVTAPAGEKGGARRSRLCWPAACPRQWVVTGGPACRTGPRRGGRPLPPVEGREGCRAPLSDGSNQTL